MGDANSTPAYEVESLSTSAMRFTVPTWRIASVQCKKGHVLGGLFVIFRPKLDDGLIEGANDEVRRMVGARMRRPYALGMTSAQGYLGPLDFDPGKLSSVAGMAHMSVTEEAGFRYAVMADAIPDSYRFVPGRPCELYLVQHPDRRLANDRPAAVLDSQTVEFRYGP